MEISKYMESLKKKKKKIKKELTLLISLLFLKIKPKTF